jgi:bacterioferritin-associated ferredoxin
MDRNQSTIACTDCPAKVVCHCLQVTEAAVIEAITSLDLRSLKEVRRHTGAGDGCTCCHAQIRQYLQQLRCAPSACS